MGWRCGTHKFRKAHRRAATAARLEKMTVIELRVQCKNKGIRGYSNWHKAQLIKSITDAIHGQNEVTTLLSQYLWISTCQDLKNTAIRLVESVRTLSISLVQIK